MGVRPPDDRRSLAAALPSKVRETADSGFESYLRSQPSYASAMFRFSMASSISPVLL
jgi:hypothetical protein